MILSYKFSRSWMLVILLGLFMGFTACDNDFEMNLPLSVTDNNLRLAAGGGSTHVLVYANDDWTASLQDESDEYWVTLEKASGKNDGEFVFNFAKNPGIARKAVVVITSGSLVQKVSFTQSGFLEGVTMAMNKKVMLLPKSGNDVNVGFSTNMGLAIDRIVSKVEYGDFNLDSNADNSDVDVVEATEEEPGWLSDVVVTEDSILYKVAENTSGGTRVARLTLLVHNTVNGQDYSTSSFVKQEAIGGYVNFACDQPVEVPSFEKTVSLEWDTNLEMLFDKVKYTVDYQEATEPWIVDFTATSGALSAKVLKSSYNGERHATLTATYDGPDGSVSSKVSIIQARPDIETSFQDVRSCLTSEGNVTLARDYIIAQVISDPNNANLETNPRSNYKTVSYIEKARTAYIQDVEGKYGFRVKLADGESYNILPRYSTVKIALADLQLVREDAPARYTLYNLKGSNVLETIPGTESDLPVKARHINDLTDDDVYTFVTFKDMQLVLPVGSWGNMNNGFANKYGGASSALISVGYDGNTSYCDVMTRLFRDINGDVIPMLINAHATWRCEGKAVPDGSGDVSGIIVNSKVPAYNHNGELGRYQFRVMSRSDIKLGSTSDFTEKIAEWKWPGGKTSDIKAVAGSNSQVAANIGSGIMDTNSKLYNTSHKTSLLANFTATTFSVKQSTEAFRYEGGWWDFTKDEGYWISWSFSTKNVTGPDRHLQIAMSMATGSQSAPNAVPIYWDVEYSTDGTSFTALKKRLVIPPAPIWEYTGLDMPGGCTEFVFDLPESLLGQENVTVRIKGAGREYLQDKTKGRFDDGWLTTSSQWVNDQYFRFDEITVKYNK